MIVFDELALRRGPDLLLERLDAQIAPGWRVGLTGANGCGKSSLLALLRRELGADNGEARWPESWQIAHLPQEIPASSRIALDYVIDGDPELRELEREVEACDDGNRQAHLYGRLDAIDAWTAEARAGRLLDGLGFSAEEQRKPLSAFSGGWRMRLGLAQTLMMRSDLLLLDEPTNHLDFEAVLWLEEWLTRYPGTLLVIAHDRRFLDAVCTHTIHIQHRRAELVSGGYSAAERARAERAAQTAAAAVRQAEERAHLENFVRRFGAKASKARQAQSKMKRLEKLDDIVLLRAARPRTLQIPAPARLPDPIVRIDQAGVAGSPQPRLAPTSLALRPEDRIGILGPNGAGKSTLLKLLAGTLAADHGERIIDPDVPIGYFAQHQREQLDLDATPLLHLQRLEPEATEQSLRDHLGRFGFSGNAAERRIGLCSGGEQVRLVLATLVRRRPAALLLDEPTNHLDLEMREALADALENYSGALLLVSHDRELLARACDRFWRVKAGHVGEYDGDLDDYVQEIAGRRDALPTHWFGPAPEDTAPAPSVAPAAAKPAASAKAKAAPKKPAKRAAPLSHEQRKNLKREVDQAERRHQRLEELLKRAEERLADPTLYQDNEQAYECARLQTERTELQEQIAAAETEWLKALERWESC